MKSIRKDLNIITIGSILIDVLYLFFGAFLISNPMIGTEAGIIVIGIILIIAGVFSLIKFIMDRFVMFRLELILGILSIALGIYILVKPLVFASFISMIVGIWLILNAVVRGVLSISFKKNNENSWIINLVISLLVLVVGIIMIVNPFVNYMIITTYVGIMIVVYSCIDILNQCLFRKRIDSILRFIK